MALGSSKIELGPVWNEGIENRGMVGNAGIGKEHDSKTEDRKIQEFYQVWCLEHRNEKSVGNI